MTLRTRIKICGLTREADLAAADKRVEDELAKSRNQTASLLADAERRAQSSAEQAPLEGPSVALVLADRKQFVDRRVDEAYPNLRTSAPRRLQGSGLDGGYAAGRKADLGGASLGRPGRRQVTR